jgi:hypothetical protein
VPVAVLGLHDLHGLDFRACHVEGVGGFAGGGVGVWGWRGVLMGGANGGDYRFERAWVWDDEMEIYRDSLAVRARVNGLGLILHRLVSVSAVQSLLAASSSCNFVVLLRKAGAPLASRSSEELLRRAS